MFAWSDAVNYTQKNYIFAIGSDAKLFSGVWTYNQSSPITLTDITGTATIGSGAPPFYQFAVLNNVLCGFRADSTTTPFQVTAYNGTASNLAGSPPSGNAVKVVNNFMFVGRQINAASTFSRVSWSNVGDPQTWAAANFLDFRKNDGDRVTALGSIGTDLYIFKFNSIGRLTTTTITTSGAVTLGPLETVFTGIGCYGPNCIDNLPDGRIVFLGNDLKLYIFDGFTLTNQLDEPIPGINIQPSLDEFSTSTFNPGSAFLKVYFPHNQIFIGIDAGAVSRVYAYDFKENFVSQWTGLSTTILAIVQSYDYLMPNNGFFGIQQSLLEGNASSLLWQLDNNTVLFGPGNDTTGANITATCTINIPLVGDFYGFIPRSLLLPIGNGGTTFTGITNGLVVTFGWDGTLLTTASFTMAVQTYPNTLVIPIPMTKEGTTSVRPMSLQIKLQVTNGGPILHPFYLSDELLN